MSKKKGEKPKDDVLPVQEYVEPPQEYDGAYDDYNDDILPETDNKRWELDENPIIQNLARELRKKMNETGVDNVLSWLRISLGKNVALSNLDQEEINAFMRDELPAFNWELVQNHKEWGLESNSARKAISRWVERSMYMQLKRAFKDGERKYRKDSYAYSENYNHDEVNASEIGSGFSMNPFRRRPKQREEYKEQEF